MEEKAHGEHPCFSLILVHVGVGQRCRTRAPDVESPATLPTMSARNVPAGFVRREAMEYNLCGREEKNDGTLHMWGSIRGKAHLLPRNAQSNGQHFSGALEGGSKS